MCSSDLDCQFSGGSIAFGIGLKVSPQVDFHNFDRCTFENAKQGFAIGCFNNVQEIVQNSRFTANDIDCGHTALGQGGGGNSAFYNCTTTGCRIKFLDLKAPGTALWYFNHMTGTAPKLIDAPTNRNYFGLVFDGCDLTGAITNGCTGAAFFIHSIIKQGRIDLTGTSGPNIFVPLFSEIENLKESKAESGAEVIAVP